MTNSRIAFFVAGLVIAVMGGFGLGRLTGGGDPTPIPAAAPPSDPGGGHTHAPGTGPHEHGGPGTTTARPGAEAGGLAVSASGYTLVPGATTLAQNQRNDFTFHVVDAQQRPVTAFEVVHDKPLHMIVVRRDLSGYQHLHPTMAPDGRWTVPLTLPAAGAWRAYADFTATGAAGRTAVTLGVDLTVSGSYAARPLPAQAKQATVAGFSVGYEGTPTSGAVQPLLFRVNGSLERYLGAYGHLVVLREGDLGYVHVHPEPELVDGAVKFWLTAPSAGRYRMFFDFQVAGKVHTAEFTLTV
ncbi:hypothetical protein [Phytohabitans rumicis]|uniref:Secreted protein n=1 Tax=Phytohabitans rumicis TaxID=1076125 RepID=A0A6V8L7C4_9ACTN|nr:hypothetical protein [Phytohabitans rumicis]GFJ89897.1 hypothetical protein Prum_035390 [Phytohabitans rumicis]